MSVIVSLNYLTKITNALSKTINSLQGNIYNKDEFKEEIAELRAIKDGMNKVLLNPRDYGFIAKIKDPE